VEESRVAGPSPSLSLASYAGRYTHDVYGDVMLEINDGSVVLRYALDYSADLRALAPRHLPCRVATQRDSGARSSRSRWAALQLDGFGTFRRAAPAAQGGT
jgi:hypothetical protein